jgi:hypothetical protein
MTDIQGPDDFQQLGRVETFPPKPSTSEELGALRARHVRSKPYEDKDQPPNDSEPRLIQSSRDQFCATGLPR